MCKFCRKHAEGYGKWYLNPDAYSEELFYKLSLLDRILGRESKKVRKAINGADSVWFPLDTSKLLDMADWAYYHKSCYRSPKQLNSFSFSCYKPFF